MAIFIPKKNLYGDTKPSAAQYNNDSALAHVFDAYYVFESKNPIDLVGKGGALTEVISPQDGGSIAYTQGGFDYGISSVSIDQAGILSSNKLLTNVGGLWQDGSTTYTIYIDCKLSALVGGPMSILSLGGATHGIEVAYRTGPKTLSFFTVNSSNLVELTCPTIIDAGDRIRLVATFDNSKLSLYCTVNSSSVNTVTSTAGYTVIPYRTGAAGILGVSTSSASGAAPTISDGWTGNVYTLGISNSHAATKEEAISLLINPYQLLKQKKKYFALSGSQSILLSLSDLLHSKTSNNLSLSQQNTLAVDSNLKSASSDNIVLTQNNIISVNAITHSNLSDNLGLLASGSLTINSALHSKTSTNLALIQSNNLSISNNLKNNLSDNLTINAGDTLNINNIIHSNTVSNIDLVQQNIIAIDSALHIKIGDNLILSQASTLSINAILHSKTDDNVTLDFSVIIDVQNSVKSITSDNLTLLQANLLSIAGNLHSNTVDNIDLTQGSTLIISDILHSYLSDNLSLIDGAVSLSTNVGTVFMLGNNRNVFVVGSKF